MVQRDDELSTKVIQAVATHRDADPLDLPQLYHAVDPEALDSLFKATAGSITFSFADCTVTAHGDGTVDVADAPTAASSAPATDVASSTD